MAALGFPGIALFVPGKDSLALVIGADDGVLIPFQIARRINSACKFLADGLPVNRRGVQIDARLFAFFDGKAMILQGCLSIAEDRLLHIALHADGFLMKPCKVALPVPLAMIGGPARPIDRLTRILFHAQAIL